MKQQTMAPPCYGARAPVGCDANDWDDPLYAPKHYEAPVLSSGVAWADSPYVSKEEIGRRATYGECWARECPLTTVAEWCQYDKAGFYRNPKGKTGMRGRGLLGKYGPNHAADVVVTRRNVQTGKYEILLVEKRLEGDETALAFPAGMVEAGEDVPTALRREFVEEAVADGEAVDLLFSLCRLGVVYRGHVDDWRNTDCAWMETTVVHFHATDMIGAQLNLQVKDIEEVRRSQWFELSAVKEMYASHYDWLRIVRIKCAEIECDRVAPPRTSAFVSHMYAPVARVHKRTADESREDDGKRAKPDSAMEVM
jgi:ADP-ribose pyrophosphatase